MWLKASRQENLWWAKGEEFNIPDERPVLQSHCTIQIHKNQKASAVVQLAPATLEILVTSRAGMQNDPRSEMRRGRDHLIPPSEILKLPPPPSPPTTPLQRGENFAL